MQPNKFTRCLPCDVAALHFSLRQLPHELLEIYEAIDRYAFPDRFEKVKSLLGLNETQEDSVIMVFPEGNDDLEMDPTVAEMNKARRIKEYFDSLEENDNSLSIEK